MQTLYAILLSMVSVFLILLVLVQRGRGGGLTGALGGMGGQSAFGTKAGDVFTRITVGAATIWILLAIIGVRFVAQRSGSSLLGDPSKVSQPADGVGGDATGSGAASSMLDDILKDSAPAEETTGSSAEGTAGGNGAGGQTPPAAETEPAE